MSQHWSVESLRADFDGIFAAPAATEHAVLQVLLCVRIGSDPFAVPIEALVGLKAREVLVPIPSQNPNLMGLVGLDGHIVPVFRLPMLLGYSVADESLRWLALCRSGQVPLALAFESVEGTVRVSPQALRPADREESRHPCVQNVVSIQDRPHSVLDMQQVIAKLQQHTQPTAGA